MLTETELQTLGYQVDDQLRDLADSPLTTIKAASEAAAGHEATGELAVPDAPAQRGLLERLTGESFETFWLKFRRHLRRDLCLPGGLLHEQWQRYRDIERKEAVRVSYAWLAAMGIPTASLAPAAVALAVFLVNVLVKVGIDAVCEGVAATEPPPSPAPAAS